MIHDSERQTIRTSADLLVCVWFPPHLDFPADVFKGNILEYKRIKFGDQISIRYM